MITLSKATFEKYLLQRRGHGDPDYRKVWDELSLGRLESFWKPGGMSIGGFARLMELPVSTIRHYLGLGLLEAYKVEGGYRFHPFNCWEVRSVVHWQDFGLSLEQIVRRRQDVQARRPGTLVLDVLGPLQIHGRQYPEGLVYLRRLPEGTGYREIVVFGLGEGEEPADPESEELFAELLGELESAGVRLQARLRELDEKMLRLGAKRSVLGCRKG